MVLYFGYASISIPRRADWNRWLCSGLRVSDSADLGWVWECALLKSSQTMLMLLVWGHTLRSTAFRNQFIRESEQEIQSMSLSTHLGFPYSGVLHSSALSGVPVPFHHFKISFLWKTYSCQAAFTLMIFSPCVLLSFLVYHSGGKSTETWDQLSNIYSGSITS